MKYVNYAIHTLLWFLSTAIIFVSLTLISHDPTLTNEQNAENYFLFLLIAVISYIPIYFTYKIYKNEKQKKMTLAKEKEQHKAVLESLNSVLTKKDEFVAKNGKLTDNVDEINKEYLDVSKQLRDLKKRHPILPSITGLDVHLKEEKKSISRAQRLTKNVGNSIETKFKY